MYMNTDFTNDDRDELIRLLDESLACTEEYLSKQRSIREAKQSNTEVKEEDDEVTEEDDIGVPVQDELDIKSEEELENADDVRYVNNYEKATNLTGTARQISDKTKRKDESRLEEKLRTPDLCSYKSQSQSNECTSFLCDKNEDCEVKPCLKVNTESREELEKLLHEEIEIKFEDQDAEEQQMKYSRKKLSKKHLKKKPFSCNKCSYKGTTSEQLKLHQRKHSKRHRTKHSGKKPLTCYLCNHKAFSPSDLKRHQLKHSSETFSCGQCGFTTVDSHVLKEHQLRHLSRGRIRHP